MAPAKRQPFGLFGRGGGNGLPVGYLAAEFLESTGTQYINTGIAVSSQAYFELDAQYLGEASKQGGGSGAGYILCADYPLASTKPSLGITYFINGGNDIRFISLGVVQSLVKPYSTERFNVSYNGKSGELLLNSSIVRNVKLTYTGKTLNTLGLFATNRSGSMSTFYAANKTIGRAFSLTLGDEDRHIELVPVLDNQGVPCMYDRVTRKPFYNSGTGQFIVGMNLEQARKLSKLPKTGATLTVSLPWEAQLVQHNAEFEAALEVARSKGWLMKVRYRDAEADSAVYNKYATCARVADMQAVNADYKHDLTADGEWLYPLNGLTNGYMLFYNGNLKGAQRFYFPKLTAGNDMFANNSGESLITEVEVDAPIVTSMRELFLSNNKSALRKVTLFTPNGKDWLRLCLRNPNLAEFWSDAENLVDASEAFSDCVLNKESVLRICSVNLGETSSGKITLGIHVDHQTDAEVLAAIEAAEAKGWTVTVQWNGTAGTSTASTYGLRRQPIYAKCGNMELPDGTSERVLDWGHYVTKWEENGYLEFASVEEAREYFNIEETAL